MLGKMEGRKRRGRQRVRCLDGITDTMYMFEQTQGDSEGQGSLACCSPWGHKESDTTEQLHNNNLMMLSNRGVGKDSLESLGLQGDQISQS